MTGSFSGTIETYVVDPEDAEPLEGEIVAFRDSDDGPIGTATTDGTGTYTVKEVPEGEFNVTVEVHGYANETVEDVTITAGEETTGVDYELESVATNSVSVSGTVTLASEIAAHEEIDIEFEYTDGTVSQEFSVITGENGEYAIIASSEFTDIDIVATDGRFFAEEENVDLPDGSKQEIDLDLHLLRRVTETNARLWWTPTDDANEQRVVRQRRWDDGWGPEETVAEGDSRMDSAVDSELLPLREYRWKLVTNSSWGFFDETDWFEATTDDAGLEQRPVPSRGWYCELEHPSGTVLRPRILEDATLEPTLNGQPRARIPVPSDDIYQSEALENAPMRVYKDGRRRAVDDLEDVEIEPGADKLIGVGGTDLEKDIEQFDVDDRPTHELVEELVEEHTDMVANVDAPDVDIDEEVVIGEVTDQISFEQLFGDLVSDETFPIGINDDGEIAIYQTCFVDDDPQGVLREEDDDEASGGTVVWNQDEGDDATWNDFNELEYTIPDEHLRVAIRFAGNGEVTQSYRLNGNEYLESTFNPDGSTAWNETRDPDEPFQSIDTVDEVRAVTTDSQSGTVSYDVVAVYDARFHDSDDFDNSVHEPEGYLDTPRHYPSEGPILETETIPQFRQAIAAGINIVTDIPDGIANLEVSADNGQSWVESGESGTADFYEDFNDPGSFLRARITPQAAEPGGTRDATPRIGYKGLTFDSVTIEADLDNTPLVLNQTPEGNLGDILERWADNANAAFEIWHDGEDTVFEWTYPGQRESDRIENLVDYDVTKHNRRVLKCKVKGATAPVRGEEIDVDELGETYPLAESDAVKGKETVRSANGERLRQDLDYDLNGAAGEITIPAGSRVDAGDTIEIDYDYTVSGTFEHEDYDGDPRTRTTEQIPAASSERAAEQAAMVIVQENSTPRWDADVTLPASDVEDIRLTDTLNLEALPGEPEVIYDVDEEGGEIQLRLGNRSPVSETVQRIQNTLSTAMQLV